MEMRKDTVRSIEAVCLFCKNGEVKLSGAAIFVGKPFGYEREPGGRVFIGRSEKKLRKNIF
jgi:hypothetical protein